jgi:hypothetical protein
MVAFVFYHFKHELAGTVQLGLYRSEGCVKFDCNFLVRKLMKIPEAHELLILGRELVDKYLYQLCLLHADSLLLRVEVLILDVDGYGLSVVVGERILNTQCIELFLADKVNGVVGRSRCGKARC